MSAISRLTRRNYINIDRWYKLFFLLMSTDNFHLYTIYSTDYGVQSLLTYSLIYSFNIIVLSDLWNLLGVFFCQIITRFSHYTQVLSIFGSERGITLREFRSLCVPPPLCAWKIVYDYDDNDEMINDYPFTFLLVEPFSLPVHLLYIFHVRVVNW
jgi:hypothetical protein